MLTPVKNLRAVIPYPDIRGRRRPARWRIKEVPGIEVRGVQTAEGENDGWLVDGVTEFVMRRESSGGKRYALAASVIRRLQGQCFSTRRKALWAVEMAVVEVRAAEQCN